MIRFRDGPAAGQVLELRRVPIMLRVVHTPTIDKWDALDLLGDVAEPREVIHVYRLASEVRSMHVLTSPRKNSRWLWIADYAYLEPVPDDQVRETAAWAAWCEENRSRLLSSAGGEPAGGDR